jgi:hypothetical protein
MAVLEHAHENRSPIGEWLGAFSHKIVFDQHRILQHEDDSLKFHMIPGGPKPVATFSHAV